MNSRDRVLAALRGETPDRVPVVEWAIDCCVARAFDCDTTNDVVDRYELDGVAIYPDCAKSWLSEETFVDEWGVTKHTATGVAPTPIGAPLAEPADLIHYSAPNPLAEHHFRSLEEAVLRFGGQKAIFFRCRDVFSIPRYLRGMTNVLEDLVLNPDLVRELVRLAVRYSIAEAQEALRRGADVIFLSDDYASNRGPMFSPAMFETYFREGLCTIVSSIHEAGGLVVKHCDGNLMPLLDMIVSTEIDALDPIDPLGSMSIAHIRSLYPKLPLKGGVPLSELRNGAPVSVRKEVRRCLEESGGVGYILSSSNSITADVKPQNFLAMIEEAITG